MQRLKSSHQLFRDPACNRRTDGVSGSPSRCKVGCIQSFAKPIICNRSAPLNHLTPSAGDNDNIRARSVDTAWRDACKQSTVGFLPPRATLACHAANCSGVSHKLDWGLLSQSGHEKDPPPCRGYSEIRSIKHPPVSHIPALGKGLDDRLKVSAIVAIEQPRDVFKHQPAGLEGGHNVERIEEEAGALAGEAAPFPCHANVLAGEAADDDVGAPQLGQAGSHVGKLLGMREAVGEHGAGDVGDFNLPFGAEADLLEAEVEAADAGKQAADGGIARRQKSGRRCRLLGPPARQAARYWARR